MKVLAILFLFVSLNCLAQGVKQVTPTFSEKTVVKDIHGTVYPFNVWIHLLQSGNYGIKPSTFDNPKDEIIIYELTQEQKNDMLKRAPKPIESPYFTTGNPFGKLKTTDMERNKINLQEMKGKVVVINFWFINCPFFKKEIPELNKLVEIYKDNKEVVFIAVALDDKYDLREFLKTTPFNYTIVDSGRWIAAGFGINSFPTNVVVDQQGIVQFHSAGYSRSLPTWIDKTIAGLLEKNNTAIQPK